MDDRSRKEKDRGGEKAPKGRGAATAATRGKGQVEERSRRFEEFEEPGRTPGSAEGER